MLSHGVSLSRRLVCGEYQNAATWMDVRVQTALPKSSASNTAKVGDGIITSGGMGLFWLCEVAFRLRDWNGRGKLLSLSISQINEGHANHVES